ncbi:MAG: glycosyltransferase, partial [Gammaproteobacteria bacterium]|nr:glycosyltransferase [Gammaproteobacteria bacterium]
MGANSNALPKWSGCIAGLGFVHECATYRTRPTLEHLAVARARHIVALAPGMREDIVAKGVDPAKVSVIPNGCDLAMFEPDPTARAQVNSWQPALGDGPLVVFTGTIGRANGLGYLV